jgi:hypothetical protein
MAVIESIIAPAFGLIGVAVGGYFTRRNDRDQRKMAFLERRLNEFYSPMLGLHKEIATESRLRALIQNLSTTAWKQAAVSELTQEDDAETIRRLQQAHRLRQQEIR